ncbi:MAG: aminodeoxychorismate/anthranilate synthase component II [Gammaproteobacteria bacterium]|nr:aminodeoxychorismate/anthranilate synthase component II [Gammaproteobacteria bacterium]
MIDNYDSFTYNLVQYIGELGAEVEVVRNDQVSLDEVVANDASHVMVSPGPGTPDQAGVSMAAIEALSGVKPVFGVCLGHQSIGQVYGGKIRHAREIMHGKTSVVIHNGVGVFAGIDNPFIATRYHSLVIDRNSLPDCLEVTAWTEDEQGELDEIMGVRHRHFAVEGVQFHPESILTEHGHALLQNFLDQTSASHRLARGNSGNTSRD